MLYQYFKNGKLERTGDDSITEGNNSSSEIVVERGMTEKVYHCILLNVFHFNSPIGIGQGRVTENMKGGFEEGIFDDAVHVPDKDSVQMVAQIIRL